MENKEYVVYALTKPKFNTAEWKGEQREFINFYGVGFLNQLKNQKYAIAVFPEWKDANIVKQRLESIRRSEFRDWLSDEKFIKFLKDNPSLFFNEAIKKFEKEPALTDEMQKKKDEYKAIMEEKNRDIYGQ